MQENKPSMTDRERESYYNTVTHKPKIEYIREEYTRMGGKVVIENQARMMFDRLVFAVSMPVFVI